MDWHVVLQHLVRSMYDDSPMSLAEATADFRGRTAEGENLALTIPRLRSRSQPRRTYL